MAGRKVEWLVLDNYFNFIHDQAEWKNTRIVFEIFPTEKGAEVHFKHLGLVPGNACYNVCYIVWGGYLGGSLRNLINNGEGQPNLRGAGSAPTHQHVAAVLRGGALGQAIGQAGIGDGNG